MKIAPEGFPFIFGSLIPGVTLGVAYAFGRWLPFLIFGVVLVLFGLACAFFFRSPVRDVPDDEAVLRSPADGRVLCVKEIDDDFVGRGHRIDIFLSLLDPHLNRIPASGRVAFVHHRPGRFLAAFKDEASQRNARTEIGIEGKRGNMRVAQIAGWIARRIVCRLRENQAVRAGQVYGLIRFGSRTEISFSQRYIPCVRPGDHVRAGESIVGRLAQDG